MVRHRRLKQADDIFQPLGTIALVAVALVATPLLLAGAWILWSADWLQRQRLLGPFAFGVLATAVVLHFVGCASTPTPAGDPRDPEIYRPVNPQYPMPQ